MGAGAKTGVETVTQIVAAWSLNKEVGWMWVWVERGSEVTDICLSVIEKYGVRSVMMEESTSVRGKRL